MTWRDRIKVHPAADRFPMMSPAELKELADDISANGQKVGVILWTPERVEDVRSRKGPNTTFLLDGRNRLDAIELAYSTPEDRENAVDAALSWDWRDGGTATLLYGDEDPDEIVISANIRRRHLSASQKREIIAELKKARPDLSTRDIAAITGVPQTTVRRAMGDATGEPFGSPGLSLPAQAVVPDAPARGAYKPEEDKPKPTDKVVGRDGKSYPAKKESGKVIQFDEKKAAATEARAVDRQVNKLKRDWETACDKARDIFIRYIDRPVFDKTKSGSVS